VAYKANEQGDGSRRPISPHLLSSIGPHLLLIYSLRHGSTLKLVGDRMSAETEALPRATVAAVGTVLP
jgi:hypothetical protein